METKQCKECGLEYPLDLFHKDRTSVDGRKAKCKDCRVAENRFRKLGITSEVYTNLMEAQDNLCAICKKPEKSLGWTKRGRKTLAVDHNHTTGQVRGLLCQRCNIALGYFNDDPHTLLSAVKYLDKWKMENETVQVSDTDSGASQASSGGDSDECYCNGWSGQTCNGPACGNL